MNNRYEISTYNIGELRARREPSAPPCDADILLVELYGDIDYEQVFMAARFGENQVIVFSFNGKVKVGVMDAGKGSDGGFGFVVSPWIRMGELSRDEQVYTDTLYFLIFGDCAGDEVCGKVRDVTRRFSDES